MEYDVKRISKERRIEPQYIEKVLRISDVLKRISSVAFLHKRLSLYGGTALNFIYFPGLPRLSFDLDFNYRQVSDADWGNERDEIDRQLKLLLGDLGYKSIAIQPTYPLLRMDIKYIGVKGMKDSFKIEIGYLRRMPILRNDGSADFNHIGNNEQIKVHTPMKEELFSNKIATLLARKKSIDLFDVSIISTIDFNWKLVKKCFAIESIMLGFNPLEIDISAFLEKISLDDYLKMRLKNGYLPDKIYKDVEELLERLFNDMDKKYVEFIQSFYREGKLKYQLLDDQDFNPHLMHYPLILWMLEKKHGKQY